jgi:Fe-S oxidoreductase
MQPLRILSRRLSFAHRIRLGERLAAGEDISGRPDLVGKGAVDDGGRVKAGPVPFVPELHVRLSGWRQIRPDHHRLSTLGGRRTWGSQEQENDPGSASLFEHIPFQEKVSNGAVFRLNKHARVLPMMGGKPFLSQMQSIELAKPLKKTVFFVGCHINFVGINVGRSVMNVLARNGCSVVVPSAQVCCGVPFFASGEIAKAVAMVRHNIDVLSQTDADAIIYACGSCGTGLREWAHHPEVGPEYIDKAEKLKTKMFEIGEYLVDQLGVQSLPALPKPTRITYHDSCHLKFSGIKEQPRRLLNMLGNVEYVEMADADSCCGSAGLFSVTHYSLSRRINARKIKNIVKLAPHIVTSGCPGCNLHIMDGLNKADNGAAVSHYIEVLNNAYECTPGDRR